MGCKGLLECEKCWECKEGRAQEGCVRGFGVQGEGRCKRCARNWWGAKGGVCEQLMG